MGKKISFIFILVFLISIIGCSKPKPISKSIAKPISKSSTVKKTEPVKPYGKNIPASPVKPYGKKIPVLMYHSIIYGKGNSNSLSIETFEKQMKYLKDNGYHTITLTDLYRYFMRVEAIPEKSVVLTFDDGYENNYSVMFPILKKYKFKATIFVITSHIDKDHKFMTSKQLLEMDKYGVDIESHTVNHEKLKMISKDKRLKTLIQSKKDLEKILNKKINYFAYPGGAYNKSAINAVKEAGYTMAFTIDGRWRGWSSKNDGLLSLHRVNINFFRDMNAFKTGISNPNYKSRAQ